MFLKSVSHLPKKCVICFIESPLKMMKNALYFILKAPFVYLFIFTLFTVDLKLLIYTKKSLDSLYSNNIELIHVNSVTEQKMQSFPKEFLKSMWTNWQTHTHLFTHSSKKHAREHLHSCVVSFLVFTV